MKTSVTLGLFLIAIVVCKTEGSEGISPYALPQVELALAEATPENFPFDSFLLRGKPVALPQAGKARQFFGRPFRFAKIDLDGDGSSEIILELQDDQYDEIKSYYLCQIIEGTLISILRTPRYFSVLPRRDSLPDIEFWHKNAEFSERHRWTFEPSTGIYHRIWAEYYKDHVIIETQIEKP